MVVASSPFLFLNVGKSFTRIADDLAIGIYNRLKPARHGNVGGMKPYFLDTVTPRP